MKAVNCPTCNGTGTVAESTQVCEPIVIGHETIECWASRPHPGQPHMAILCDPCYGCGAYEEHHDSCVLYDAQPAPDVAEEWWRWNDGNLAVARAEPDHAFAWSRRYGPNADRYGTAA